MEIPRRLRPQVKARCTTCGLEEAITPYRDIRLNVALQERARRRASELSYTSSASQRMGTSDFVQVTS